MDNLFKQDARLGRLVTDAGTDKLVLLRFTGSDAMNELFKYEVEALSVDPDVDFDALIGTHASVELQTRNHDGRWFDGIITQARWMGTGETGNRYNLTLRPWTYIASKRRNQKIFHNKTVVQILQEVFTTYESLGSPAFEDKLTKSYVELEYTVQYRESDLEFAARLMERFGISYYFAHKEGTHTLVLCDSVEENPQIPGNSREYIGLTGHHHSDEEHFWKWAPERNLTTGAIRLTDFNFKKPTAAMEVDRPGDAKYAQGKIESFDFPGDYLVEGEGKGVSQLRINQERSKDHKHDAEGDCISLSSGMKVTLTGEKLPGVKAKEFLCLKATHNFTSDSYGSGEEVKSDELAFRGQYQLAPVSAPMVSERQTALPIVQGPQTAMVVGEGEIDCDDHGRILVHFHWDLAKAHSMRCRVSQNWASNGWGGMVIPRIGMEVVVEFLEGDPDKPLVTGCVYNGKNKPPYELPANKTRSTFKTDSHQADGFNELRFEDKAGEEEVFFHAQKDRNEKVLHNDTARIDNNLVQSVGNNKALETTNNQDEVVGGNITLSVGPGFISDIVGGAPIKDWQGIGSLGYTYGEAGKAPKGEGNYTLAIEKTRNETVGEHRNLTVGKKRTESVGTDYQMDVGTHYNVGVEKNHSDSAGKKRSIVAGDQIDLVCGDSRITMKKNGDITISCKNFTVSAKSDIKEIASKVSVKASGPITLKGSKISQN